MQHFCFLNLVPQSTHQDGKSSQSPELKVFEQPCCLPVRHGKCGTLGLGFLFVCFSLCVLDSSLQVTLGTRSFWFPSPRTPALLCYYWGSRLGLGFRKVSSVLFARASPHSLNSFLALHLLQGCQLFWGGSFLVVLVLLILGAMSWSPFGKGCAIIYLF